MYPLPSAKAHCTKESWHKAQVWSYHSLEKCLGYAVWHLTKSSYHGMKYDDALTAVLGDKGDIETTDFTYDDRCRMREETRVWDQKRKSSRDKQGSSKKSRKDNAQSSSWNNNDNDQGQDLDSWGGWPGTDSNLIPDPNNWQADDYQKDWKQPGADGATDENITKLMDKFEKWSTPSSRTTAAVAR